MSKSLNQIPNKITDYYAWQCHHCQRIQDAFAVRCEHCDYFKPSLPKAVYAESLVYHKNSTQEPQVKEDLSEHDDLENSEDVLNITPTKISDQKSYDSLDRLFEVWEHAKHKKKDVSAEQKVEFYESLLDYFLHVQRHTIQHKYWQHMHVKHKSKSMKHLTFMWFLGICTGLAFYYALDMMRVLS